MRSGSFYVSHACVGSPWVCADPLGETCALAQPAGQPRLARYAHEAAGAEFRASGEVRHLQPPVFVKHHELATKEPDGDACCGRHALTMNSNVEAKRVAVETVNVVRACIAHVVDDGLGWVVRSYSWNESMKTLAPLDLAVSSRAEPPGLGVDATLVAYPHLVDLALLTAELQTCWC